MGKYVYRFSKELTEGNKEMRNLLGGKGANLHEMSKLGLRVPPGFTITSESCVYFFKNGQKWVEGLLTQVEDSLAWLEGVNDKGFGNPDNPLLVSVRSGARISMPGMMDTVLNLGLNDRTVDDGFGGLNSVLLVDDRFPRVAIEAGDGKIREGDLSLRTDAFVTRVAPEVGQIVSDRRRVEQRTLHSISAATSTESPCPTTASSRSRTLTSSSNTETPTGPGG